jgi:hypothetical protein
MPVISRSPFDSLTRNPQLVRSAIVVLGVETTLAVPERSRGVTLGSTASAVPRWQTGPTVEITRACRSGSVLVFDYEDSLRNQFRRSYC